MSLPRLSSSTGISSVAPASQARTARVSRKSAGTPGDDLVPAAADRLLRRGSLQQPFGDTRQSGVVLAPVQAEQVYLRGRRKEAAEAGVMQEHRLLDERHDGTSIGDAGAGLLRPPDQLILEWPA